jgi:uncharacterized protein DUF5916
LPAIPRAGTRLAARGASLAVLCACLISSPASARGQSVTAAPVDGDGPPAPVAPAVISRDDQGRAVVRAVRLLQPLRIDGRLDEPIYADVNPITDFIQQEPREGAAASEKTDVWLTYDNDNVYVSVRCWETHPERTVRREMRRDNPVIFRAGHDSIGFMFDTYHDRRSGYIFNVNAIGGRADGQFPNERQYNGDWNPVWDVRTGRFEEGWTVEAAIPFKSLRYQPQGAQLWGFQLRRTSGWRNELSYITRVPAGRSTGGTQMAAVAATVVGLEAPPLSRNLEIKPFAASSASTVSSGPTAGNDLDIDVGGDAKYSITQNLTADLTVNTDFAQVEADEQQVNLTRFSLFFPEKREFFLENDTLFAFGGGSRSGTGSNTPVLFYSRQIGLNGGRAVPIDAGGRLTGRHGKFSVGALNIQTHREVVSNARPTNFTVLRLKRDILRRSSIGALFTRRSVSTRGSGSNETYGVDGAFAFFSNLNVNTYWAQTATPGLDLTPWSYRGQVDYRADRYGLELERLVVGESFNPEVGFLRRQALDRNYASFRFSPRIAARTSLVRKLSWEAHLDHITGRRTRRLETREALAQFGMEFRNSDQLSLAYTQNYEYLAQPFAIAPGVSIPTGGYDFQDVRATYTMGLQRKVSSQVMAQRGSFYNGDRTTLNVSAARLNLTPQLLIEPNISVNWVDLPQGSFTNHLVGSRATMSMTPYMFFAALIQYQSDRKSVSSNLRFRWEYLPGSEFFVVLNEERDTAAPRFPSLQNRSLIVKVNRLLRF